MNARAYYNENDAFAAAWLRELIAAGLIAPGEVDERSIVDVRASDLDGYTQCHWFAGIGGWSLALRMAGWPDDRPVWTGSCPCQPFSAAGKRKGFADERHLWPEWQRLIAERSPAIVFGEQVEAAIGWGWLDAVFSDLEGEGYACGATVLPACGVGAPHIRQRTWFVANAAWGNQRRHSGVSRNETGARRVEARPPDGDPVGGSGTVGVLADAGGVGAGRHAGNAQRKAAQGNRTGSEDRGNLARGPFSLRSTSDLANAAGGGQREFGDAALARSGGYADGGFWADCDFIPCTDGKARPVRPGSFPLAHGVQRRTSKLRGYGNAIVPQVAAEFIAAAEEAMRDAA